VDYQIIIFKVFFEMKSSPDKDWILFNKIIYYENRMILRWQNF